MGLDRLVAILAGEDSIREVIAFPKTQSGWDPMTGAPSPLLPAALEAVGLRALPPAHGAVGARWPPRTSSPARPPSGWPQRAPLAARLRPRTLDEIVGQQHLVGRGRPARAPWWRRDRLTSAILWGPPGTGKTTLATVIAGSHGQAFVPLSAVTAGVKDVREVIESARRLLGEQGRGTILFLDEVHRFNKAQQDALLPSVEEGLLVLIGATTENPFFEVNAPLLSRSTLWRLEPLSAEDLEEVVRRGLTCGGGRGRDRRRRRRWWGWPTATPGPPSALSRSHWPWPAPVPIGREDVERARASRLHHYGESEHYDQVSAFIKSIRGSDPDAGLYWLARMLAAGEDARFIARRLVILASEDVGEADPMSLVVADAAARAVEFVGLPEAQLNLAQAVVHLACAPKSNRVTVALVAGQGRRGRGPDGRGPRPPARRPLPQRLAHRPRGGLRLPARRPRGLGRTGVPSAVGGRPTATTSRATGATRRRWPSAWPDRRTGHPGGGGGVIRSRKSEQVGDRTGQSEPSSDSAVGARARRPSGHGGGRPGRWGGTGGAPPSSTAQRDRRPIGQRPPGR